MWSETGHSEADVQAIWDEIVLKIPTGASVLELGCGEGGFAAKLRAADPTVTYRGIDLVPETITAAQAAVPAETFEVNPIWDVLTEGMSFSPVAVGTDGPGPAPEAPAVTPPSWDYVVSIHTAFSFTETRVGSTLLQLINARAVKGFFILMSPGSMPDDDPKSGFDGQAQIEVAAAVPLKDKMAAFVAASTDVTGSYDGDAARDFLEEPLIKGLIPIYINRDSVTATIPRVRTRYLLKRGQGYNRHLAYHEQKRRKRQELDPVSDTPGFDENGDWVTNLSFPNMVD